MERFPMHLAVRLHSSDIDGDFPPGGEGLFGADDAVRDGRAVAHDPLEDQAPLQLQIRIHREPEGELPALELFDEGEVCFGLGLGRCFFFAFLCRRTIVAGGKHRFK